MHIHLLHHLDGAEISALPLISRNKVYFLTEPKIIMFTILLPLFPVASLHAPFQLKCVVLTREFFGTVARCGMANEFLLYGGQRQHQTAEGASEMEFGLAFVVCLPRKCIRLSRQVRVTRSAYAISTTIVHLARIETILFAIATWMRRNLIIFLFNTVFGVFRV